MNFIGVAIAACALMLSNHSRWVVHFPFRTDLYPSVTPARLLNSLLMKYFLFILGLAAAPSTFRKHPWTGKWACSFTAAGRFLHRRSTTHVHTQLYMAACIDVVLVVSISSACTDISCTRSKRVNTKLWSNQSFWVGEEKRYTHS